MQKLSIQEQKAIIAGGYGFKAYYPDGTIAYFYFEYGSKSEAKTARSNMLKEHPDWTFTSVEQR